MAETTSAAETTEKNDFLPQGEGWVEVSTSGAPIFKPELAVAEGAFLQGIAYDVILCRGGANECKVWEGILIRLEHPTVAMRGEEQVTVEAGEDVLVANHAILSDVARRATRPTTAQRVKLQPTEQKEHATNKKWSYWDYRIAFGPVVDRAKEGLDRLPENEPILEILAKFEKGLGGKAPDQGSKPILQSFHRRLNVLKAMGTPFVPQLEETTSAA